MRLAIRRDPFNWMKMMTDEDPFNWVDYTDDVEMDVYEEGDNVIVKVKAPGYEEKALDISVEGNNLTVTGKTETEEEEKDKDRKYYRKEIRKDHLQDQSACRHR